MKNIYNIEKYKCTGCDLCKSVCPVQAIHLVPNKKGFLYPEIDKNLCIDCGLCYKKCPQNSHNMLHKIDKQKIYAGWAKDEQTRNFSTSGGIFYLIGKKFLEKGFVVYGCILDKNNKAIHKKAESILELKKMRGSKYVQSELGNVFKEILEYVNKETRVLFSGTPCQVDALKSFIGYKSDFLYTIDIVCHGVPSPKVFRDYLSNMSSRYISHGNISEINFRYKKPSWSNFSMKIEFQDGFKYIGNKHSDFYLRSFLENYITRDSCHYCKYTNLNRQSDITLGDFWSYISESKKYRNDEKGINLIIINSSKGEKLIDLIKNNIHLVKKNQNDALRSNKCLSEPYKENENEDLYWRQYYHFGNIEKFDTKFFNYKNKVSIKHKLNTYYQNHYYLINPKLTKFINLIIRRAKKK